MSLPVCQSNILFVNSNLEWLCETAQSYNAYIGGMLTPDEVISVVISLCVCMVWAWGLEPIEMNVHVHAVYLSKVAS